MMSSLSFEHAGADVLVLIDDDQSNVPEGAMRYAVEWVTDECRRSLEVIASSIDEVAQIVERANSADEMCPRTTATRVLIDWLES